MTEQQQSTRYTIAARAAHATGQECPNCDRGPAAITFSHGSFWCRGCNHEWTKEDIENDE